MTKLQLTQIFADIDLPAYGFNKWFKPSGFAYIVLKDNSLLYIGDKDMWYLDGTDELMYVAGALTNTSTGVLSMPTTGVVHQNNVDRFTVIIDFENINHIVLGYQGQYLGGGR
jgi:hypothetical protein